ncbi:hypothetical protein C4K33_6064 [Pseudomonas chlororaphis subsp. piscium]|nr:hypothetical protein C4K33_6064 [Pseudomonas chlororaphis subsp. piscium]
MSLVIIGSRTEKKRSSSLLILLVTMLFTQMVAVVAPYVEKY